MAFAKVMAPVLPFVTETLYQQLVVEQADAAAPALRASVHHCDYPEADPALIDPALEADMAVVRSVVGLGRGLRRAHAVRVRQPLPSLTVVSHDAAVRAAVDAHAELIAEELNVKVVATSEDERAHAHLSAKPNYRRLGPRLGARMKALAVEIEALDEAAVAALLGGETLPGGRRGDRPRRRRRGPHPPARSGGRRRRAPGPWPSTPPSPRSWPERAWPAKWSRRSRPGGAPPASRWPIASPSPGPPTTRRWSPPSPSTATGSPARCWRWRCVRGARRRRESLVDVDGHTVWIRVVKR